MRRFQPLLLSLLLLLAALPPAPALFAGTDSPGAADRPAALPAGWQVRTLHTRGDAGASAQLVLDGNDRPHILYTQTAGSSALRHAWYDGVTWRDELVVDLAPNQYFTVRPLRLAAAGTLLAAAWQDPSTNRAVVALRQPDGVWAVQPEAPVGQNSQFSLALWNSRPAFAWYDTGGQQLLFAGLDENGQWQQETVDSSRNPGEYNSIAVSPDGIVHIAYFEREGLDLRYARRALEGGWTPLTLHSFGNAGLTTAIALDSGGFPHIAFVVFSPTGSADLYYLYQEAVGWSGSLPVAYGTVGGALSVHVDAEGTARILFSRYGQRLGVYLVENSLEGWNETTLGLQLPASLGMDSGGRAHLAHYDSRYRDLKYALRGDEWETATVVPQMSSRAYFGAAQDGDGAPLFSVDWGEIQQVQWQNNGWSSTPVTSTTTGGGDHSSLAYDVEGFGHIAFYQEAGGDLIYGRRAAGQWSFETVDSQGDVGRYPKMLVRSNLNPVIVYWDATNFRLKVAEFVEGRWRFTLQPEGASLNADSDRFDAAGFAPDGSLFITYYDAATTDLRLARVSRRYAEWTWTDSLIGSNEGDSGHVSAAAMGGGGSYLAIAFSHVGSDGNGALRYGYLPTSGNTPPWTIGQISAAHLSQKRVVGVDVGLKNGSHHMPRIAYITRSNSGDHELWLSSKDGESSNWRHTQMAGDVTPRLARPVPPAVFVDPVDRVAWQDINSLYLRSRFSDENHPGTVASDARVRAAVAGTDGALGLICVCLIFGCLRQELNRYQPARSAGEQAAATDDRLLEERLHAQFVTTSDGQRYVDIYAAHGEEIYNIIAADPALMGDAFRALENYTPALIALAAGQGEGMILDSGMIDTARDIWQRLAAAGSPELATAINSELAATNNLSDFTGKTVAESAEEIGVDPQALARVLLYLPLTTR